MSRHSNIYNALYSFYRDSVDELFKSLEIAFNQRIGQNEKYEAERLSFPGELGAVVQLAKDQAIHFNKTANMIQDWERDYLITQTLSYADKTLRRARTKGYVGQNKQLEEIGDIWDFFG